MHSMLTRAAALGIAGIIAASAVVPASAATRTKRTAAPAQATTAVQSELTEQNVRLPTSPTWSALPTPAWQPPNTCVSDEGYSRYSSCDSGTGS